MGKVGSIDRTTVREGRLRKCATLELGVEVGCASLTRSTDCQDVVDMPAERPNVSGTSSSSNRRSSKPLMEKRRRARINQSLAELKNLIVDSGKKENTRYNKLEKADILEMTVKHLQLLHRQKLTDCTDSSSHINKFRAGFNECVHQVSRFVDRLEGLDSNVRMRLINHLAACINNTESSEQRTVVVNPAYMDSEASTSCDSERRMNSSISPSSVSPATYRPVMAASSIYSGALPLVASRLPTGEIAFVLPAALMATGSDAYSHLVPLLGSSQHVTFPSPDRASSVISNTSEDGGSAPSCSSSDSDNNSIAEIPLEMDTESVWRPW